MFLLLKWVNHLLEVILKAHSLNVLSLHFGRQQTVEAQNLPLLQGEGHALRDKYRRVSELVIVTKYISAQLHN